VRDVQILHIIFANSAQILRNVSTRFFSYGTIVCDNGVLSWLVGPLKLRVTIQLTLSLQLLKMLVTSGWLVYRCQPVSVLQVQSCTLQKKINNEWYTVQF